MKGALISPIPLPFPSLHTRLTLATPASHAGYIPLPVTLATLVSYNFYDRRFMIHLFMH